MQHISLVKKKYYLKKHNKNLKVKTPDSIAIGSFCIYRVLIGAYFLLALLTVSPFTGTSPSVSKAGSV